MNFFARRCLPNQLFLKQVIEESTIIDLVKCLKKVTKRLGTILSLSLLGKARNGNHRRLYLSPDLSVARLYQAERDPEYLHVAYRGRRREALKCRRKPIISEHYILS